MSDERPQWSWLATAQFRDRDEPHHCAVIAPHRAGALVKIYDYRAVEWCSTPEVVERVG